MVKILLHCHVRLHTRPLSIDTMFSKARRGLSFVLLVLLFAVDIFIKKRSYFINITIIYSNYAALKHKEYQPIDLFCPQHDHHDHDHSHDDHHHHHEPGMPFDFAYSVNEDGNDYSHNAKSDGDVTHGEYRIALPDGRTQIVKYTADWKNGFNAEVCVLSSV